MAPLLCLRHNASCPAAKSSLTVGEAHKYVKPDETGTRQSETKKMKLETTSRMALIAPCRKKI